MNITLRLASLSALFYAGAVLAPHAARAQTEILFVGNSFTHGRYAPALNYNAGTAAGTGNVHDLLCPSLPCGASGGENVLPVTPSQNPPAGTLPTQLTYLQNNPGAQYTEPGPRGGVPGVFLQFTKEAGLNYDVSMIAVSSATLTGYLNNTGNEAGDLPLIADPKYGKVVLQDQSFQPLPTTINVNGQSVTTRGNPASFQKGVSGLINAIDAADKKAGVANAGITLYETQPLAVYGYTSSNPAAPIFGSSTGPAGSIYAPYVGDANPMAAMSSDLHNAYVGEAAAYNAANPAGSKVGVALAGDAWITAMNLGIAQQNPYLVSEPSGQVDLWDSNPLDACCTTPIGYHPSADGSYLNALVLFGQITGVNPETLDAEWDPSNPAYLDSAAYAFGISPALASALAVVAEDTLLAGGPVLVAEPPAIALFGFSVALLGAALSRRVRRCGDGRASPG